MKRAISFVGCVAGLLSVCGCLHLPSRCDGPPPPPLPEALRELFPRSPFTPVRILETEIETRPDYRLLRIELSTGTNQTGTNPPIILEYYQVPDGRRPVILVLPIAGGRHYDVEAIFARHFARQGFATVIAHRRRIPREFDLSAMDPWQQHTVEDNARALDWIETRPELDASRIGIFGISLGGIRGVFLTALDQRVKAAALGLVGGDVPYILTHSQDRGIVKRREKFLRKRNLTPPELEAELRQTIAREPNDFASHIEPGKVMLVLGMFDRVVPFKRGWELRERMGKPETLLLPTGHYSSVIAIPYIQKQSQLFFERRLGPPPDSAERKRVRSPRDASQ